MSNAMAPIFLVDLENTEMFVILAYTKITFEGSVVALLECLST